MTAVAVRRAKAAIVLVAVYAVTGITILMVREGRCRRIGMRSDAKSWICAVGVADLADPVRGRPRSGIHRGSVHSCIQSEEACIRMCTARPRKEDWLSVTGQGPLRGIGSGDCLIHSLYVRRGVRVARSTDKLAVLAPRDSPSAISKVLG